MKYFRMPTKASELYKESRMYYNEFDNPKFYGSSVSKPKQYQGIGSKIDNQRDEYPGPKERSKAHLFPNGVNYVSSRSVDQKPSYNTVGNFKFESMENEPKHGMVSTMYNRPLNKTAGNRQITARKYNLNQSVDEINPTYTIAGVDKEFPDSTLAEDPNRPHIGFLDTNKKRNDILKKQAFGDY